LSASAIQSQVTSQFDPLGSDLTISSVLTSDSNGTIGAVPLQPYSARISADKKDIYSYNVEFKIDMAQEELIQLKIKFNGIPDEGELNWSRPGRHQEIKAFIRGDDNSKQNTINFLEGYEYKVWGSAANQMETASFQGWFDAGSPFSIDFIVESSSIPEPSTLTMAGIGVVGLLILRKFSKTKPL